ncbi:uncharacterized protein LOC125247003 isoform X2 [Megalobrama amblycephala]|uniref:uncharacterized protein LOC125247003 isoform X2 n=1 Tax=Megalobrama amblycephala TaxID=75352 RepID=UPI0020142FE6|nr:uncharacterized protein LOC125247003 isoform X2 [Megalobrama amblycephala]
MADNLCLLGLIILSSLLTGTSGVDDDHVFISSGENVRLPCNNALSDCKSPTWKYNRFRHSAIDLIDGGIKNKDTERHERLSLGSDCSLNIKNVTEEDYGFYICRQYVNGQKQGTDAGVYLHVLHVSVSPSSSSSSSQTEISSGRSVTLSCQLDLYDGFPCVYWVRSEGLHLLWVNQAGVDLKTDSRYQILFSSDHCIITLTTTLLNEDDNREWRCQLTLRNQLQTSVRYTVKYSVSSSNSEKKSSQTTAAAPTQENQKTLNTPNSEGTAAAQTPGFTEQQDEHLNIHLLIPVSSSNSEKKSSQTTAAAPTQENQKSLNTPNSEGTAAAQTPGFTEQQDEHLNIHLLIPVSSSNSEKKSSQTTAAAPTQGPADTASETEVSVTAGSLFRVIVIIVGMAVFAAPTVILLQIICARRAGRKDSQHPEEIEMPTILQ